MRGTAAGQQSPQGSLKIPHEQRVDNRVHGAVTVAEPSDGIEQRRRHALAHSLNKQHTKVTQRSKKGVNMQSRLEDWKRSLMSSVCREKVKGRLERR